MWTKLGSWGGQGEMALVWLQELLADMPEYRGDARIASAGAFTIQSLDARAIRSCVGTLGAVGGRAIWPWCGCRNC
eukprot:1140557-Pelagomonas_calceolata.AAC.5